MSPFGVHNIAKVGFEMGRKPGDWYGAQAICTALQTLNEKYKPFDSFKMVVCKDGNIFFDQIEKTLKERKGNGVFISVPVMLGLNAIQPEYLECLKQVFLFESTLGICGGERHKALYFVGIVNPAAEDPKLLFLDPHFVQDSNQSEPLKAWRSASTKLPIPIQNQSVPIKLSTYHCNELRTMSLSKISTGLAIGFYVSNIEQFNRFKLKLTAIAKMEHSFFSVFEKSSDSPQYLYEENLKK